MRRRSVVPLVLALALLLPTIPAHAGRPAPKKLPPLRFSAPLQVEAYDPIGSALGNGDRQPSGEPSIKVDSRGTIYIAGVDTVGKASPVWISQNRGRSFDVLHTPGQFRELSPLGAEGDIAIGADDSMYFVDTGVAFLAFTKWGAAPGYGDQPTWQYTYPHTLGVEPGVEDRPWLAYGDDGASEALWLYVNNAAYIAVYKSTDQGLTWTAMTDTIPQQLYFPGMVAAPRNSTKDAYLFGDCGQGSSLCSRATHDGGTTWNEVTVANTSEGFRIAGIMVANAVDLGGTVYGTWAEAGDGPRNAQNGGPDPDLGCQVFYAASRDGGATWGKKVRVSDGHGCAVFPWVAAGSDGRLAFAWYQNSASAQSADVVPADSSWFLHAAVVVGANTPHPRIVQGVADHDAVHVGPLGRELWDFLQIAIGPDGKFNIAYVEDVTAGLNGPLGAGVPDSLLILGAQDPKDTMYVRQAGGPSLIAPTHHGPVPSPSPL